MAFIKVCNMCGKTINSMSKGDFNVNYSYGYFSNHDGSSLELDLCNDCLEKLTNYLIDNCKINPVID